MLTICVIGGVNLICYYYWGCCCLCCGGVGHLVLSPLSVGVVGVFLLKSVFLGFAKQLLMVSIIVVIIVWASLLMFCFCFVFVLLDIFCHNTIMVGVVFIGSWYVSEIYCLGLNSWYV